ncbi:hypothetical protein PsorP6_012475 [Peronosclerospora sorghi]|uniref:Uncharacterized protein n=1 Tax=Peronosclerospora sorghi TaxID=230839 RepID=A0ACC0WGQ7_9STRA|nr:hypothetical protein PsorP6_012475 [Peronosclerospora sorghi]
MVLKQQQFIAKLLDRFGQCDDNPFRNPLVVGQDLSPSDAHVTLDNKSRYEEMIGALLYTANGLYMLNVYPRTTVSVYNGVAVQFGPEIGGACHAIHDVCKGFGTNEPGLIAALGTKSATQRYLIARRYKELYHKDLKAVLKHETSSDFGHLLQLLAQPLPEAEVTILYKATKGLDTKEKFTRL